MGKNKTAIRLSGLDALKALAALLVIFIHTGYPNETSGPFVVAASRIAVPCFLLISGYFYPIKKDKINSTLGKTFALTLLASIFYVIVDEKRMNDVFPLTKIEKMLMFDLPFAGDHLWYMFSLLHVLVIILVCEKLRIREKLYYLIPLLFIMNYALSFSEKFWLYRNFLFTSLPYFLTGCFLREKGVFLFNFLQEKMVFFGILLTELVLLYIEINIYKYCGLLAVRDHYVMTFLMSLTVFIYCLKDFGNNIITHVGRKYSAYIYIFHIYTRWRN